MLSMEKMDLRLLEAATDLYSNRIELIRKIILPLSMPGIIGGSILVFVPCLGAFIAPDLLGGGKKLLLGSLIQFQFSYARNWPFGAAMAMFLLALVILVLIFNARLNRKHKNMQTKNKKTKFRYVWNFPGFGGWTAIFFAFYTYLFYPSLLQL